jgi:lactate 2-monooxygenase
MSGGRAGPGSWPVGERDWEARAREAMGPEGFDWIAGGAGEEWTLDANREAFRRWGLRPRVLTGNAERDLSVRILGTPSAAPFLLAPIGGQTVAHPDGETAVGRAAARCGIPFIVAGAASHPMERVAEAMGAAPRWYQLYWISDREVVESLVARASSSGYGAIVLTVDTPILGLRDRDARAGYSPFVLGHGVGQYTSDPVFRSRLARPPEEDPRGAGEALSRIFSNPGLSWRDLGWLRDRTELPIVIKGILTADDARRCLEHGMDAIVVSNHGARQLDGCVPALDALVEIRETLGDETTLLMDSGIRRGTDVVKALALGADAVLLGRPYVYGLAIGGEAGVEHVLRTLIAEVDNVLGNLGARAAAEVDRSFVSRLPG